MKQGIAETTLVILILTMLGAGIMGGFAYKYISEQKEHEPEEICKLSIFTAAQSKRVAGGTPLVSIDCERMELDITKDDIVDGDKINQEKASKIIANAMARCWNMVGEGRMDPFSQWDPGNSYCLICKQIKFDAALKNFMKKSQGGIVPPFTYLATTTLPGKEQTYWQYLYNSEGTADLKEAEKSLVADGTNIVVTMYKIEGKSEFWTYAGGISGGVLVVVGGVLVFTGVGAPIGALLIKVGAGIGIAAVGTAILIPTAKSAFTYCPECNAVGGMALIPPGFDFNQEIPLEARGEKIEMPFCSLLVN